MVHTDRNNRNINHNLSRINKGKLNKLIPNNISIKLNIIDFHYMIVVILNLAVKTKQ